MKHPDVWPDQFQVAGGRPRKGWVTMSSMSISGTGSWNASVAGGAVNGTLGAPGVSAHHHHHGGDVIATAAKALGMSTDDVKSALQNGKSLDDLAKDKGVSHDALVAAIKTGMPRGLQSSDKADAMAEGIVTRKGMPAGGPPPGGRPDADGDDVAGTGIFGANLTATQGKTLDQLASLLGTDSSSLLSALKSGTSLADMVQSKLAAVLQDGLLVDTKA
jgi:lambda repressor-like predicted transcriptional regulator